MSNPNLARRFQGEIEQVLDGYRDQGLTRTEALGALLAVLLTFFLISGEPE
jgi:hypothetical protein